MRWKDLSLAPALVAAAAVIGCRFEPSVPKAAQLSCSSSGDCPTGMRCAGLIALCVENDGDDTPPDAEAFLSAQLLPAHGELLVSIVPSEPLAAPPEVQAGHDSERADAAAEGYRASFSAAELGEGVHAAVAILIDASGNLGIVTVGAFEIDATPPALDPDVPLAFRIIPPPDIVVASPQRVTRGATIEVGFDVSEPLGAPAEVVARGPEDRPFVAIGERDGLLMFTLLADPPLAAGTYSVSADLVDAAGNSARIDVPVPSPGIVADAVVPSPCVAVDGDGVPQCTDFDGDGAFGLSPGCALPAPYDCDDSDPTSHTDALELPGDGRDNDCLGDGDLLLDEQTAIFADPAAPATGAGTRDDPLKDLFTATELAASEGKMLALRSGAFSDLPAGWFTSMTVVGGLDASWQPELGATTTLAFVTGNDTVFPSAPRHAYVGLAFTSSRSLIDTNADVLLVRCRIDVPDRAMFAGDATLIDVDIVGGWLDALSVRIINSRLTGGDLFTQSGLMLRTRFDGQFQYASPGEIKVVSSSLRSIARDRGFSVSGKVFVFGSTLQVRAATLNDQDPPAVIDFIDGDMIIVSSAVAAQGALVSYTGGDLQMDGVALAASCGIYSGGACVLPVDATDCAGVTGCSVWSGVVPLGDAAIDASDPWRVDALALLGPGPALLERGAPTAAAGDLNGRCRDTRAPSLGAFEPTP